LKWVQDVMIFPYSLLKGPGNFPRAFSLFKTSV